MGAFTKWFRDRFGQLDPTELKRCPIDGNWVIREDGWEGAGAPRENVYCSEECAEEAAKSWAW